MPGKGVLWSSLTLEAPILNTAAFDATTGSVYVGTQGRRLWRLDATIGQVLVSNQPGGEIHMAPLLVNDTVYIGSTSGNFYAFDTTTLAQRWVYHAGAVLIASTAYSANQSGLIILLAEDRSVHAIRTADGTRAWRTVVNADPDPMRGNRYFNDAYPVVSEVNGVVIVRSYFNGNKTWQPSGGAQSLPQGIYQRRCDLLAQ